MSHRKIKNTKTIAVIGTILVWIPILFTLIISAIGSIATRKFLFDYLMPAELFPLALIGTLLLLWASKRSKIFIAPIGWCLFIMIASLGGSQGAAVLTGLAHGDAEPTGWKWLLVITLLILYIAMVITQCILGIFLIRRIKEKK